MQGQDQGCSLPGAKDTLRWAPAVSISAWDTASGSPCGHSSVLRAWRWLWEAEKLCSSPPPAGREARVVSPNGRGGWTPLRPLRGLQETRVAPIFPSGCEGTLGVALESLHPELPRGPSGRMGGVGTPGTAGARGPSHPSPPAPNPSQHQSLFQ